MAALAAAAAWSDPPRMDDPTRPVRTLGRTYAVLQWYTPSPCETRIQLRPGSVPCRTPGPDGKPRDLWKGPSVRVVDGTPGKRTFHVLTVRNLKPGTRYTYRIYDPGARPTGQERRWGAEAPWRREYSFSTLAPSGRKTIIRVPVKVLLMPNVWNVASAYADPAHPAPPPPRMSEAELRRIRDEYAASARFLFINSGMRVWYDYTFFVDDRVQRWGPEPEAAAGPYKGLPVCRSYGGQDYMGPGGGDFTILDTSRVTTTNREPVYERFPYVGQIEQAFPRRWNPGRKAWEFYGSGGGTYGMDEWDRGIPGRSQFLGGSDTAWLATHEYHHQIESLGAFSLANREDDRVIFDHFFPRKRERRADGTWEEWVWSTSWKHGEHWDGIAHFDRMLTPVQWLRLHFGQTITVADADEDGVPDDDPRLPFDEKRFGSDPKKARTDGVLNDLAKAQLSTWAPGPLTDSWRKAPLRRIMPNPHKADSDGDGLLDAVDPYPLYPWAPFIWPGTAEVDGTDREWAHVPPAGEAADHGVSVQFRQMHDEAAYYACFRLQGDWQRVWVGLDGEGQGYYTTNSTYAFEIRPGTGDEPATVRPVSGNKCAGMTWKSGRGPDGSVIVELAVTNRGESLWFWQGGGREVGASISLWTADGKPMSIYEPYALFYARMLERHGRTELPPGAPAELQHAVGVVEHDFASGTGDWKPGKGWTLVQGAMRYSDGPEDANQLLLDGLNAREFDLWAEFEAGNDLHLGAWKASTTVPNNVTDYVVFLGGFGNARSAIRAFGNEVGAEESGIGTGRHTVQFTRRRGMLWVLYDGKPFIFGRDPEPALTVQRLGFLGGWGGAQAIYKVRMRLD
jgi:hypothetical protein